MLIQCTKKLLDKLGKKPETPTEYEPLFSWHANLLTIQRRNTVVLVNDENRFIIVLYGLLAKDFRRLNKIIPESIGHFLQEYGIKEEVIKKYIEHSPTIIFTKTKDRTTVARMNQSIDPIHAMEDLLDPQHIFQTTLSRELNKFMVGVGKDSYIHPHKEIITSLEEFSGTPVMQTKAVQLNITLDLERYHVSRRLVVPLHYQFSDLHKAIQIAFGWQDYHLHEFYIYDHNEKSNTDERFIYHPQYQEGRKPILNIVTDEESLHIGNDDIPRQLEAGLKLTDYVPKYQKMRYIYDFGDSWRHDIEVEKVIDSYAEPYPTCIDGEGNAPPEDVGGEPGFEMFNEIMANKADPEYESMVAWARSQGYKDFSIESVNRRLKNNF